MIRVTEWIKEHPILSTAIVLGGIGLLKHALSPKKHKMISHYTYGRRKEVQVGQFLEANGFQVALTPGSRGPYDIIANKGRRMWLIQSKATRRRYISSDRLTIRGETELVQVAKENGAIPAVALITRNYMTLITLPDWQTQIETPLKPLSHT